jgi:hypothetical protein
MSNIVAPIASHPRVGDAVGAWDVPRRCVKVMALFSGAVEDTTTGGRG